LLAILGASIASVFAPTDASYVRAATIEPPIVIAAPQETLPEMAARIALAHGIATSTLANLAASESNWNPNAVGDDDCSYGLTQQNICATKVTKEEALDPETALTIAAEDIAAHRESRYTVCNCWGYLSTRIKSLPRMAAIQPTGPAQIGAVAIFWYKDKQMGAPVKHIAEIAKMDATGFTVLETNFTHCLYDRRWISWDDPHLEGFWSP
jgi:hypothetical protein